MTQKKDLLIYNISRIVKQKENVCVILEIDENIMNFDNEVTIEGNRLFSSNDVTTITVSFTIVVTCTQSSSL